MIPFVTANHIAAMSDLGVAGAAIFAAWQGVKSLKVWREEKLGIRRMELAEEALVQFYQIAHAFGSIRSPMGDAAEHAEREPEDFETETQRHWRNVAFTTWERLKTHNEEFQNFYKTGLKLRAVFGAEIYESCEDLRKCYGRVRVASRMLFQIPPNGYNDADFHQRLEQDIWDMDREDEGSIESWVKLSVLNAERILGAVLRDH